MSSDLGDPTARPFQFGLGAVLLLTLDVALLLGYLRVSGFAAWQLLLGFLPEAVVVGMAFGLWCGRVADAMCWSVLGGLFALLAVVGQQVSHEGGRYAWPLLGAVCGAAIGSRQPGAPLRRMTIGSRVAGIVFLGYAAIVAPRGAAMNVLLLEFVSALLAGAILANVVEVIEWLELRTRIARSITTAALLGAVLLAYHLAAQFLPGWQVAR